jgi:hypothetical protein
MITMTPSTASSPSRVNAPNRPSWVGEATGISVIAYPSSAAWSAIASTVRLLPVVASVKRMTPIVRNSPRLSARAALLGR